MKGWQRQAGQSESRNCMAAITDRRRADPAASRTGQKGWLPVCLQPPLPPQCLFHVLSPLSCVRNKNLLPLCPNPNLSQSPQRRPELQNKILIYFLRQ